MGELCCRCVKKKTWLQIIVAFSDALDIDKSGFGIALASALVSLAKTLQGSSGRKTRRDLKDFFNGRKQHTQIM